MGYTKEKLKKRDFVHKELRALLCAIDPDITGAEYFFNDDGEEVVKVYYDAEVVRVDVTCDSLAALTRDVLRKV